MRVVSSRLPLLGLMLGDYTGIEPEQCARVLSDGRLHDAARLLVVGDAGVLQQGARDVGIELAWHRCAAPETVDWSRPDQGQIATKLQGFNRGLHLGRFFDIGVAQGGCSNDNPQDNVIPYGSAAEKEHEW